MNLLFKYYKYCNAFVVFIALLSFIGCSVPEKYPQPVSEMNVETILE